MEILLSYSIRHFDPARSVDSHEFWGSSAQVLAKTLYDILVTFGTVTYVDFNDFAIVSGREFDIHIGITNNFLCFCNETKAKRRILFAVNNHASKQRSLMHEAVHNTGCVLDFGMQSVLQQQVHEMRQILSSVDYILGVGNNYTRQSFVEQGFPSVKCKFLNYGAVRTGGLVPESNKDKIVFSYVVSEIGARKGFEIIRDLFTSTAMQNKNFFLNIAGVANPFYEQQLSELVDNLGLKCCFHGWLDSSSDAYRQLLQDSDIMICPSIEEGQIGTLVEAMSYSVIPLGTKYSGIDFAPLGMLETKCNSTTNNALLQNILEMSAEEILTAKKKTQEYYSIFHSVFETSFRSTLSDVIMKDTLYPLISIVVPIFNKGKTIISLLKKLHRSCISYGNVELHIIFDGCVDDTESKVRDYYRGKDDYLVTFEVTPDIFEVKSNNIGLKKSQGKYCIIIQDDIYIDDCFLFLEAVNFLEKAPSIAILGCLAGVNFYPRGTVGLQGEGQIQVTPNEVYWRQDADTDSDLRNYFFEVDACMRGPLIIRRSFLLEHGYLDEIYAPLYNDDMDICFRARDKGYKVFAMLGGVRNASLTMAAYDPTKWEKMALIMKRNTDIFYSRYTPSVVKNYLKVRRSQFQKNYTIIQRIAEKLAYASDYLYCACYNLAKKGKRYLKKIVSLRHDDGTYNRKARWCWLEKRLGEIPAGLRILDAGAGQQALKPLCKHLRYVAQDFGQYNGEGDKKGLQTGIWDQSKLDIISDIIAIPEPNSSFDAILCTEVFEHLPDPLLALKEFSRLLKPGGTLVLTAPFCSFVHFSPYFFGTGFSEYWYKKHLVGCGFEIQELTANGNFSTFLDQEVARIPSMASCHAKVHLTLCDRLGLRLVRHLLGKMIKNDTSSHEFACFGFHVIARKL